MKKKIIQFYLKLNRYLVQFQGFDWLIEYI